MFVHTACMINWIAVHAALMIVDIIGITTEITVRIAFHTFRAAVSIVCWCVAHHDVSCPQIDITNDDTADTAADIAVRIVFQIVLAVVSIVCWFADHHAVTAPQIDMMIFLAVDIAEDTA